MEVQRPMWQVFQTRHWKSSTAVELINSVGGCAWTPMQTFFVRRRWVRKPEKKVMPILPNILFVEDFEFRNDLLFEIHRTKFFPLRFNSIPMLVSDESLDPLRALEHNQNKEESKAVDCNGVLLDIEDEVEVIAGPFIGTRGKIESWNNSHFQILINGFDIRFLAAPFLLRKTER